MKWSNAWITALFFLLTFFSAGGGTVESLVNYPTWLLIGETEFRAFHQALGPRIVVTMVIPMLLSTLCNAAMLWVRPLAIPRWSIWISLRLALLMWMASIFIQIPIQAQLSTVGFSRTAIDKLITTDLLFRVLPSYLRVALSFWMLLRILQRTAVSQAAVSS